MGRKVWPESSGGGGGVLLQRMILSSGAYVAPFTGSYMIAAFGAGGAGSTAFGQGSDLKIAFGGAGGGAAFKMVRLNAGESLDIAVGSGGTAATATVGNTPGGSGGATTVTGAGISIIANGGAGGPVSTVSTGNTTPPLGGTASGGDVNISGGRPDVVTAGGFGYTGGAASGVYLFTPPNRTVVHSSSNGDGGSVLGTQLVQANYAKSQVALITNSGGDGYGSVFAPEFGMEFSGGNFLQPCGRRGAVTNQNSGGLFEFSNSGSGAGGVRNAFTSNVGGSTYQYRGGPAGFFAGGGAAVSFNQTGYPSSCTGGDGGDFGGGGGPSVLIGNPVFAGSTGVAGKGGSGGVIIQFIGN